MRNGVGGGVCAGNAGCVGGGGCMVDCREQICRNELFECVNN